MTSPKATPQSPKLRGRVEFHPQGDVILLAGKDSGKFEFHISSQILCLASPVFLDILGPRSGFKEAGDLKVGQATGNPPEVPLPDDDPTAWSTILYAIHNRFDLVPRELAHMQLYNIAVVCDKYGMRVAIGVWVGYVWFPALGPPSLFDQNSRLYMAYVFALKPTFKLITREIVLHQGDQSTSSADFLLDKVFRAMESSRSDANRHMLECTHDLLNEYLSKKAVGKCNKGGGEACDNLILGGLIRALHKKDLYPLPDPTTHQPGRTPSMLWLLLSSLDISEFYTELVRDSFLCKCGKYTHHAQRGKCHEESCSPLPAFRKKLDEIYHGVQGLDYDYFI